MRAGADALRLIRTRGLRAEDVMLDVSTQLGEELRDLVVSGRISDHVRPW